MYIECVWKIEKYTYIYSVGYVRYIRRKKAYNTLGPSQEKEEGRRKKWREDSHTYRQRAEGKR